MTQRIADIANVSTPKGVEVGSDMGSLITWALAKFGAGAVFLIFLGIVYQDLRDARHETVELMRESIRVNQEMRQAIITMNNTLERIEDARE